MEANTSESGFVESLADTMDNLEISNENGDEYETSKSVMEDADGEMLSTEKNFDESKHQDDVRDVIEMDLIMGDTENEVFEDCSSNEEFCEKIFFDYGKLKNVDAEIKLAKYIGVKEDFGEVLISPKEEEVNSSLDVAEISLDVYDVKEFENDLDEANTCFCAERDGCQKESSIVGDKVKVTAHGLLNWVFDESRGEVVSEQPENDGVIILAKKKTELAEGERDEIDCERDEKKENFIYSKKKTTFTVDGDSFEKIKDLMSLSENYDVSIDENISLKNKFACEKSENSVGSAASDLRRKYIEEHTSNELEEKLSNKKPAHRKSIKQQDAIKNARITEYNGRNIPEINLKYSKTNKAEMCMMEKFHDKFYEQERKKEYKFGRISSSTSHTSNEEAFQTPDDSLSEKIVEQAEFYFSDFNILKNNFLLKLIRRTREGFVSLKLVTSFRKVKALTRDWRVVAYSLEGSNILELNAEKTKVRRIEKIPKIQDSSMGKSVVVFHLPSKSMTPEDLKELFSKFGPVAKVQIISTKSPSFNAYHKRCFYFNAKISTDDFGVVEFEKYEDAAAAVKDEDSHLPKENQMRVVPLTSPKYKYKHPSAMRSSSSTSVSYSRGSRGRYKRMPRNRQVEDEKAAEFRQPIRRDYYRGYYRPRYVCQPQSYENVGKKLAYNGEVGENNQARRQLGVSNAMNVIPFHQRQLASARFISGARSYGTRSNV